MLVKYYNDKELAYTNRKRFCVFNFVPFFQEEQKSILLGDGATTKIKTKKSNICNYVEIDGTRWYVISYVHLNGGQVQLNLQRDVIGEFGINGCFGKIERGFTDNLLKNRKELGLNQILKERKMLIPSSNIYGNYTVDNHEREMWGIMYFTKPSSVDPTTGEKYPDEVNINIPGFTPTCVEYDFIEDGTSINVGITSTSFIEFVVKFEDFDTCFLVRLDFSYLYSNWHCSVNATVTNNGSYDVIADVSVQGSYGTDLVAYKNYAIRFGRLVANALTDNNNMDFVLPSTDGINTSAIDYNGITIKKEDNFYSYTTKLEYYNIWGSYNTDKNVFFENVIKINTNSKKYIDKYTEGGLGSETSVTFYSVKSNSYSYFPHLKIQTLASGHKRIYNYTVLSKEDAGIFTIDVTKQLIDEPYIVLAVPLYDVFMSGGSGEEYSVKKDVAFMVFNTVIQYLSGQNAYLVDAQIYPYCPVLTSCSTKVMGIPFFSVNSTCYEHNCQVQLLPSVDVKKDYIERVYSIISPEKTGKFDFHFYDYKNEIEDNNGVNYSKLNIIVKTALKPFSILSSAVITPDVGSLIGITYASDMRGSQPSSNGFQCSLSSNAFQEYKRQNSNYQQIFALQKGELEMQHKVERVNDKTATVINTATATAMGAMAGSAAADGFWGDLFHLQAGGAATGGATAGATVGAAMATQSAMNEKLRDYEVYLQQQMFDLQIGTIKNLPNSVNRISSFNEIMMKDFWYCIEIYECSDSEKVIVNNFIEKYGYGIGVFDYIINYYKEGWFIRSTLISSNYPVNLHLIAEKELMGGIYLYE